MLKYGVNVKSAVQDKKWQEIRQSLLGQWSNNPVTCIKTLREYLGPIQKSGTKELVQVLNYLTGTGFRTGVIKHEEISKLRKEVSEELKRRS